MAGALGRVTKKFDKLIEELDIPCNVIDIQKTVLLGTAMMLRKAKE